MTTMTARPSSWRTPLRLSLALALTVLATGCILLVDSADDSLGTTCHFQGELTQCGQCVAKSCQAQVNACCGAGAACMGEVDACASGNCAAVSVGTADWKSCAAAQCASPCGIASSSDAGDGGGGEAGSSDGGSDAPIESAGPTKTACQVTASQCLCKLDAPPNGVVCDSSAVINAHCCADLAWPSSGSCTCETMSCELNSYGCECGLVQSGPRFDCKPNASQPNCCAPHDTGSCLCNNKICESWFGAPVPECTAATTPCPTGKKAVQGCSF